MSEEVERPRVPAEHRGEQRAPQRDEGSDSEAAPTLHGEDYIIAFAGMRHRWLAVRPDA